MYSSSRLRWLAPKHGEHGSWAVWDREQKRDVAVIWDNHRDLHCRFVFVGLNISKGVPKKSWANFHGSRHDRKLKYACNDTKLRGSYMTDLFKGINMRDSKDLDKYLRKKTSLILKNVQTFTEELHDVGVTEKSVLIVLGGVAKKYFKRHFASSVETRRVIFQRHYSDFGTDRSWVESLWRKTGVKRDFKAMLSRYR